MLRRATVIAFLITLAGAGAGHAQTSVSGRATLLVGELLTLRVLSGGEEVPVKAAGVTAGGSSASVDAGSSARGVMVEVVANRGWQLSAVVEAENGQRWTTAPIASGGPGRTPVRLNYAMLVTEAGADPDATVRLTLSPL